MHSGLETKQQTSNLQPKADDVTGITTSDRHGYLYAGVAWTHLIQHRQSINLLTTFKISNTLAPEFSESSPPSIRAQLAI